MTTGFTLGKQWWREVVFQIVLHGIIFIFYTIDRKNPQIEGYEVAFFLQYVLAALFINYFLLPRFFYRKKYLAFLAFLILIIVGSVIAEEWILEQIFFPDTRGTSFPGIFYTLLGILPMVTILVGVKFGWDAFNKQREVDRLQAAVKESELQFLKSQINPHFLFNNLNNLYSYAIENSPKTPEIILDLSSVLRYMLYDCKAEFVPLSKEIEQIEKFIKISEMQIEDRGQVQFSAPRQTEGFQIAPLILMVFIENTFKHSTASQSDNIDINVQLDISEKGLLQFHCSNTYHEQTNINNLSSGIGLENVQKRLQLLYPNAHQLQIEKKENRFTVDLSLHLLRTN